MDAASSSQPAREAAVRGSVASGVVYAPLKEVHPERIVVGERVLFLRDGATCTYTIGTPLEVIFTERDGRSFADKITPVKQGH